MKNLEKICTWLNHSEDLRNDETYKEEMIRKYGSVDQIPGYCEISNKERIKSEIVGFFSGVYSTFTPLIICTKIRASMSAEKKVFGHHSHQNPHKKLSEDLISEGFAFSMSAFGIKHKERIPYGGYQSWPFAEFHRMEAHRLGRFYGKMLGIIPQLMFAYEKPKEALVGYLATNIISGIYEIYRNKKMKGGKK